MELREQIASIVASELSGAECAYGTHRDIADAILAIPEIAEALRIKKDYDEARLGPSV